MLLFKVVELITTTVEILFIVCFSFEQVLESFFRRALAWEKEESVRGLNVVEEKDSVFFFTNNIQEKVEVRILMTEEEKALPYLKIKGMAPGFEGFHLAILRLNEVNSVILDSSSV